LVESTRVALLSGIAIADSLLAAGIVSPAVVLSATAGLTALSETAVTAESLVVEALSRTLDRTVSGGLCLVEGFAAAGAYPLMVLSDG